MQHGIHIRLHLELRPSSPKLKFAYGLEFDKIKYEANIDINKVNLLVLWICSQILEKLNSMLGVNTWPTVIETEKCFIKFTPISVK